MRIGEIAAPVAPRTIGTAAAASGVLAADAVAGAPQPPWPIAITDGWAVEAAAVADAGSYAPVPLATAPIWVESGDALPEGCDAVLPPDGLAAGAMGKEAIVAAAPGDGMVPAGFDASAGQVLARAGQRLTALTAAALVAAGIRTVAVRRPRIAVALLRATDDGRNNESTVDAVSLWLLNALAAAGAEPVPLAAAAPETVLADFAAAGMPPDALITIGGTGEGRRDRAVAALAEAGELALHGMAIRPGASVALGRIAGRPVLMLPGRPDGALAAWLTAGAALVRRLSGVSEAPPAARHGLARKIVSTIGLAEVVLVAHDGEGVRPLAAGLYPFAALAAADGFVLVPPESEGYPTGATVAVRPLS